MVTQDEIRQADELAAELLPYLWETITAEEVSDVIAELMNLGYTITKTNEQ